MPGPTEFDLRVADTFLAKSVDAAAPTLTLGHDAGSTFVNLPTPPFWLVIDPDDPSARESVLVTALSGPIATVKRAFRNSAAIHHRAGAPIRLAGQRIGCQVRRSTQTPIATATQTSINWNIQDADTDNFIAIPSTTVTIPAGLGGLYAITVKTEWGAALGTAGSTIRNLTMIVPTAADPNFASQFRNANDPADAPNQVSAIIPLAAGDSFTVDVFQTSGANQSVTAWMTCNLVGV